jgi:adenylate cyclase
MNPNRANPPFGLRHTKVLLVMDVVESVRLMEQDEDDFVRRWQRLVEGVEAQLPQHGGRIVKSLGDGLMIEFGEAAAFSRAALGIQQLNAELNAATDAPGRIHLRMGAHLAQFVSDRHDIYGTDVNLTARISTLAGPDEIVISSELRDQLTDGLDAELEDLGDCHLKHVAEPVRAYRIGRAGPAPVLPPAESYAPMHSTVAVVPFEARSNEPEHFAIGDLIADGVISQLGRTAELRVISRLSSAAFRGRDTSVAELAKTLAATYVLSGSYVASSGKLLIMAELADTRTGAVIWSDRIGGDIGDLLQEQSELSHRLASAVHNAVMQSEVQSTLVKPLPTLESCSLLLGGIALTHRASRRDFDRAREALDALVERHPRAAQARSWLAKWYILRVVRGMSDAPGQDARRAIEQTERALDAEPECTLALAIQGHALCQLSRDVEGAARRIDAAIELNPNESLGWLYKSVWSSMWGSTEASVQEAETAALLSPIDPMKYYYDMILASGLSINGQHERAIELAKRSLKANRHHQPTLRVLLLAQAESDQVDEAQATLKMLIQESPNLTVSSYLSMGGAASSPRQRLAAILRRLGVPEY